MYIPLGAAILASRVRKYACEQQPVSTHVFMARTHGGPLLQSEPVLLCMMYRVLHKRATLCAWCLLVS